MYWEGGALLLTLSEQPCSRATTSPSTFAVSGHRPAVHPSPDHSSDVAGGPCVRGWRRNPAGGSSAIPRGPIQTWKNQLLAQDCSSDGGLACAKLSCWHMGQKVVEVLIALKLKWTCALTCSHLGLCLQMKSSAISSRSCLALRLSPAKC